MCGGVNLEEVNSRPTCYIDGFELRARSVYDMSVTHQSNTSWKAASWFQMSGWQATTPTSQRIAHRHVSLHNWTKATVPNTLDVDWHWKHKKIAKHD